MIQESTIEELVEEAITEDANLFVVEVNVRPGNKIKVVLDGDEGISIERCSLVSRHIHRHLDREVEDYGLEVSSPGLTEPLQKQRQFVKNVGRMMELMLEAGDKVKGKLLEADDKNLVIETVIKEKVKGKKAKKKNVEMKLDMAHVKTARVLVEFRK